MRKIEGFGSRTGESPAKVGLGVLTHEPHVPVIPQNYQLMLRTSFTAMYKSLGVLGLAGL